jgi:hypothetical protein
MRAAAFLPILALACALAGPAGAQAKCVGAACDRDGPWRKLTRAEVYLADPDSPHLEIFRAEFDPARRDVAIHVDVRRPEGEARGTVLMVGGRMLMVRGLPLERGREIEALDWPLVNIQLAQIVLGRVFPDGPASLKGERAFDHSGKAPIEYGTASTRGRIEAPWRAEGSAAQVQPGLVTFAFTLSSPLKTGKKTETLRMRFRGELAMLERPVLPDDGSLEGWSAFALGPRAEKRGDKTVVGFGTTGDVLPAFKTVADARAYIAEREKAAAARK